MLSDKDLNEQYNNLMLWIREGRNYSNNYPNIEQINNQSIDLRSCRLISTNLLVGYSRLHFEIERLILSNSIH
jgi:hypothetical protein